MAYGNFKPTVWSKYIQHELEKSVFCPSGATRNSRAKQNIMKWLKF